MVGAILAHLMFQLSTCKKVEASILRSSPIKRTNQLIQLAYWIVSDVAMYRVNNHDLRPSIT